jgi:hypothetical protein
MLNAIFKLTKLDANMQKDQTVIFHDFEYFSRLICHINIVLGLIVLTGLA